MDGDRNKLDTDKCTDQSDTAHAAADGESREAYLSACVASDVYSGIGSVSCIHSGEREDRARDHNDKACAKRQVEGHASVKSSARRSISSRFPLLIS